MKSMIASAEHSRVLETSPDVPEERPSFAIGLTEVGITAKTVWVRLPHGRLPFSARIVVDQPGEVRGIHMSRIEEAVAELYEQEFMSLKEYGVELGRNVLAKQRGSSGSILLSGQVPVLQETVVSSRTSIDSMQITAEIRFLKIDEEISEESILIGCGVNHITACPCTQAYNQILFNKKGSSCPLPTHSQRSFTSLKVETARSTIRYQDLLSCLGAALHITQDLMKRSDEAEIVLKAHQKPQFAEDAVRETARIVGQRFADILPGSAKIIIESLSLESIHIHDVICRLECTMKEIAGPQ